VRVVAALAQLHDDVEESCLGLALAARAVDSVNVLLQDLFVPFDLHVGHAQVQVDLLLGQKTLFDVTLDSAKQEWAENAVQLLDNGVLVAVLAGEPLIKSLRVAENIGQQEVEERPKFVEVVLQGRSGNQQAVSRREKT